MDYIKIILGCIQFANWLTGFLAAREAMQAGAARQIATALAALQVRLGISAQVAAEVAALSDAELDSELKGP